MWILDVIWYADYWKRYFLWVIMLSDITFKCYACHCVPCGAPTSLLYFELHLDLCRKNVTCHNWFFFSFPDFESLLNDGESKRDWKAVRVDFVFVPSSQWGYALLGWTGSKLYMRLLRHYSNHYLNMLLNSHGLWNRADNVLLPAKNEEEVFQNLGLSYKEPCDRNF